MNETHATETPTLYEEGGDELVRADQAADRVTLLQSRRTGEPGRVRIMWGQDMVQDLLDGRYRTMICGVNAEDNSHGIISQLVKLMPASQWSPRAVTSYAKVIHDSITSQDRQSREPYVLKFDLDRILVLGLLRPKGQEHFTIDDLSRGMRTAVSMLKGRHDRMPVATVSFLGARSNRLVDPKTGREPSFERVLSVMHEAGFSGDAYPSPHMWSLAGVGVYPSFPFPEGLEKMRRGSS